MENFELLEDEVVLYEGEVESKSHDASLKITLTSQKIVLESERGIVRKTREQVDTVALTTVKWYHDAAQIKQHGSSVEIQTTSGNYAFTFTGIIEARKFINKAIEAVTDMTLAKRVSEKTKKAIDLVDDTLETDTRGTIKGVFSQGIKGVLWNGIGKKK